MQLRLFFSSFIIIRLFWCTSSMLPLPLPVMARGRSPPCLCYRSSSTVSQMKMLSKKKKKKCYVTEELSCILG